MSQSPVTAGEFQAARDPESEYRRSLAHVNQLLRHGGSLSGHEANCAFLNLAGEPFATVSSVTGFDYLDDSRAITLADWDHDGDLDVWVANRTAPRLRFLRNQIPNHHHFLALRLTGVRSNRDAIGARIEVRQADDQPVMVRSLRAGEGFLSQSSKWLHFGLGPNNRPVTLTVTWPDGEVERWEEVECDRHYLVTQGSKELVSWRRPQPANAITPGALPNDPETESARIVLSTRVPLPPIRYTSTTDRVPAELFGPTADATLVNLWASWCIPCLEELKAFRDRATDLEAGGVRVVALAVDQAVPSRPGGGPNPAQILERLRPRFDTGLLSAEGLQRLTDLHALPFASHVDLPVPVSFLVDRQGWIAVIYRGPVSPDIVQRDARQLDEYARQGVMAGLPAAGRWNEPLPASSSLRVVRDLAQANAWDDAQRMVKQHHPLFARHTEFPQTLLWLGDKLLSSGKPLEAIEQFRAVLAIDPNNLTALNNLAWQLATQTDPSLRAGPEAVRHAERANQLTEGKNPGILDTLAASYAAVGRRGDAVATAARARDLAQAAGDQALAGRIEQRRRQYEAATTEQ